MKYLLHHTAKIGAFCNAPLMMDLDTLYTTMQPGHTDPGMVEYQPIDNSILFLARGQWRGVSVLCTSWAEEAMQWGRWREKAGKGSWSWSCQWDQVAGSWRGLSWE